MSNETSPAAEVHIAHKAVVETVRAMRARFPKLSADGMVKHTAGAVAAMCFERIEALEKRIAELEAIPRLKYTGVWNVHNQYNEADLATHDGSVFYCKKSTRDKPGTSDNWKLMVKRGADGKDVRR
jgi:hypothetical protein